MKKDKLQHLIQGMMVLFGLVLLFPQQSMAQSLVKGQVFENPASGAAFATVALLNASDSSLVKGAITDENGIYQFQTVAPGQYMISVSSVGFNKYTTPPFVVSNNGALLTIETITLGEAAITLNEVVVKTQRKVIERTPDRFVMNVEASTFQSDNLMDIFQALPFVQVQGENISVNGKGGILILLDKVQMPGATLQTILQTMTGDEIEKIEFITSPSSRYPSNINTVISITTKKGKTLGLTGSVRSNVSQGIKARGTAGTSLTYRKEKWVANLNLNYERSQNYSTNEGHRISQLNGNRIVFNENYQFLYNKSIPSLRGMFEYKIAKNHSLGMQTNHSYTDIFNNSVSNKKIGFSSEVGGKPDSLLVSDALDYGTRRLQNYSLYYSGKLDSLGKSLDLIFTYTPVRNDLTNEMLFQHIINPEGAIINRLRTVRNINPNRANILVGQMDWELPLHKQWNITTGAKLTSSSNRTQPTQEYLQEQQFVKDASYSFDNLFEEQILAGYATMNKVIGGTTISAGLRMEHATMLVENRVDGNRPVDRRFTDLFPTLMVSRSLSDDLKLTLNYRKTIQRPGFSVLTPYRIYIDDFTVQEGNPKLLPHYINSVSLNGVYKSNLYVELEYRDEQNVYTNLPEVINGIAIWKDRNFDLRYYALNSNYAYKVAPWWSGSVNAMGALYNSSMKQENFKDLHIPSSFYHTMGVENSFSLPKDLKLETSFTYTGPYSFGLANLVANHYTRIAIKGSLFNKKLQYTLAAMDLFRGAVTGGTVNSVNINTTMLSYYDYRRVQLGLVYRFGKQAVKGANSKKLGNEDVINRVD